MHIEIEMHKIEAAALASIMRDSANVIMLAHDEQVKVEGSADTAMEVNAHLLAMYITSRIIDTFDLCWPETCRDMCLSNSRDMGPFEPEVISQEEAEGLMEDLRASSMIVTARHCVGRLQEEVECVLKPDQNPLHTLSLRIADDSTPYIGRIVGAMDAARSAMVIAAKFPQLSVSQGKIVVSTVNAMNMLRAALIESFELEHCSACDLREICIALGKADIRTSVEQSQNELAESVATIIKSNGHSASAQAMDYVNDTISDELKQKVHEKVGREVGRQDSHTQANRYGLHVEDPLDVAIVEDITVLDVIESKQQLMEVTVRMTPRQAAVMREFLGMAELRVVTHFYGLLNRGVMDQRALRNMALTISYLEAFRHWMCIRYELYEMNDSECDGGDCKQTASLWTHRIYETENLHKRISTQSLGCTQEDCRDHAPDEPLVDFTFEISHLEARIMWLICASSHVKFVEDVDEAASSGDAYTTREMLKAIGVVNYIAGSISEQTGLAPEEFPRDMAEEAITYTEEQAQRWVETDYRVPGLEDVSDEQVLNFTLGTMKVSDALNKLRELMGEDNNIEQILKDMGLL